MCAQCMTTAVTAGVAATGLRAWAGAHGPAWLTPMRLRRATAALLAIAVAGAGVSFG